MAAAKARSAETFQILPDPQSEFAFNVKKTGLMSGKSHHFVFRAFGGTVKRKPDPEVSFTVQANSIDCQDDWVKPSDREKIKRYALEEMLEAARFPTLKYVSTSIKATADGYVIAGSLTIKDKTRPALVQVARKRDAATGSFWQGTADVSLSDFGLKAPKAVLGAIGTEDKMQVAFKLKDVSPQ